LIRESAGARYEPVLLPLGDVNLRAFHVLATVALLMLSACVPPPDLTSTYNPAEVAWAEKTGTATINGQAFLRRNDGVVVYAAGSTAILTPRSTYADERFSKTFPNGARLSYFGMNFKTTDPVYAQSGRTAVADGEGKFTFTNLPSGTYYLTIPVVWMVQDVRQGGLLMVPVTLADGETKQVIMSGQ
jgi:hypothetical protein